MGKNKNEPEHEILIDSEFDQYDYSSDDTIDYYKHAVVTQHGGNPQSQADVMKYTATGSFPPIYIAEEPEKEKTVDKTRGFQSQKIAVSMKEIMQERRDDSKPFISF